MPHDVALTLHGDQAAGDELRSLYGWLADDDDLRGRVKLVERDPEPGALGPIADTLMVLQAPAVALAGALVAWIRSRHSDLDVTITRPDGSKTTISAKRVARLDHDQLGPMLAHIAGELEPDEPTTT